MSTTTRKNSAVIPAAPRSRSIDLVVGDEAPGPAPGALGAVSSREKSGPNCWGCRYFAISWDPHRPYACQLMGFKTKMLPSIEVLRTDGRFCQGFVAKN